MKRSVFCSFSLLLVFVLSAARPAPDGVCSDVIEIQVSPHTIILSLSERAKGAVRVTVHADIDFRTVKTVTVKLGIFPAIATFADSRGDLVAKFNYEDVKSLVAGGNSELTLTGIRVDGTDFQGTDTVRIME